MHLCSVIVDPLYQFEVVGGWALNVALSQALKDITAVGAGCGAGGFPYKRQKGYDNFGCSLVEDA